MNPLKLFGRGKEFANLFSLSAHNRLVRFANAMLKFSVRSGEKSSLVVSDHNAVLTLSSSDFGGVGGAGLAIRCAVLDVDENDVISCAVLSGATAGTTISVTRPSLLHADITSEVYEPGGLAITVTFTYSDTQTRTAAASGYVTHTQKILPKYHVRVYDPGDPEVILTEGSILYVLETETGYIDLNVDAREWQAVPYIPVS